MKRVIATTIAIGLLAGVALADEVTLGRPGMDAVFVWLDEEAHSEALDLIRAGVHESNPALVMRLLACIAAPGDKAVITDMGMFSHTIVVIDGEEAGCRGLVTMEDVR